MKGEGLQLQGVFSVLPTPFLEDGSLDLESLNNVVELYIGAGVNGLTALGVTSEVARLTESERDTVLRTVIAQVRGRVPVVAGTSAEGQRLCLEYSRAAKSAGAAAVMVSPPRMPKLNSDAVVKHYQALAAAVDVPSVIQDYPPVPATPWSLAPLARIAREVPSARTIKLEDPPTPFKTARILQHAEGMTIHILGGLGGVFLLEELLAGAAGVMTGFAYPEILVEVMEAFRAGDPGRAAHLFYGKVARCGSNFRRASAWRFARRCCAAAEPSAITPSGHRERCSMRKRLRPSTAFSLGFPARYARRSSSIRDSLIASAAFAPSRPPRSRTARRGRHRRTHIPRHVGLLHPLVSTAPLRVKTHPRDFGRSQHCDCPAPKNIAFRSRASGLGEYNNSPAAHPCLPAARFFAV